MSESSALYAGQTVGAGRFTLVRALGRGGMGEVWLAQDERLGEPVALKFLPPEVRADPVALHELRRETARSQKLTHPNIVRIHDLHEDPGGLAFIAMEYVDGPTLSALRLEQPNYLLTWEYLRPLVQQLCAALDYAHGEKVIHRDLKPANVMVDSKGRLKLADFGIAATVSDSVSRVSGRHNTSGTLPYMSPQQLAGKRPQVADDIYALGATLYELLTSQPPFYTGDITHQVLHEATEALEERLAGLGIQNDIPPDVAALVMTCLVKDPAQRPQSARALAEWIGLEVVSTPSLQNLSNEMFGADRSEESVGPSEAGDAIPQPSSSRRNLLLAGGAAALVLVGLGGWFRATRPPPGGGHASQPQAGTTGSDSSSVPIEPASQPAAATPEIPASTALAPVAPEPGFVSLFNGHDLSGWDGDPRFWSVEGNAIKGQSTEGNIPQNGNTYLIWTNGIVDDFELRFSYKLVNGETGSGVQYRGRRTTGWIVQGYQADFWPVATGQSGLLWYEAPGRVGVALVPPGEKAVWGADGKKQVIGATPKTATSIQAAIKEGDWNEYVITASGSHLVQQINGNTTIEMTDNDVQRRFLSGLLSLKMRPNKGNPMLVYFKNIRLKRLTQGRAVSGSPAPTGLAWLPLFDGKTLSGWTAPDPGDWKVAADGSIVGQGKLSHLFSPGNYANLEFKAEAKLNHGGNSGMFFRAALGKGYPKGYEAQVENTAGDPQKTGSLYNFHKVTEQLVQDDTWCVQHIVAIGNRIVIKVNDQIVTDFVDEKNTYTSGRLALQQNTPATVVRFRNLAVKPLPADEAAAWAEARKDMPDLAR